MLSCGRGVWRHGTQDRRLAGHARADGAEDARDDGSAPWLRDRAAIEQTSQDLLSLNYGTLYPALLKLEQEGYISSAWGVSDNNRRARFYTLTRAGRKQLAAEAREWQLTTEILARFLAPREG